MLRSKNPPTDWDGKIRTAGRPVMPPASRSFAYGFFKRHIPEVESILNLLVSSADRFLLVTLWHVLRFPFSPPSRKWKTWVSRHGHTRQLQVEQRIRDLIHEPGASRALATPAGGLGADHCFPRAIRRISNRGSAIRIPRKVLKT